MKKTSLILSLSVLALASCSNDELVNTVPNPVQNQRAIGFNHQMGNMSRGESQLETTAADFGVWGIKGASQAAAVADLTNANLVAGNGAANVIMNNYLVGYYNGDDSDPAGYKPTAGQADYSAASGNKYWYYEGLGNNEDGSNNGNFTWYNFGAFTGASTSANAKQYLKYWDESAAYTFFYAYAPYSYKNAANEAPQLMLADTNSDGNVDTPYLEFKGMQGGTTTVAADGTVTIGAGNCPNVMYACTRVASANYGNDVNIKFERLLSQIRLAFYEEIPGYSVEMMPLNNTQATKGIVLVPTSADDNTKINADSKGYITASDAVVYFNEETTGLVASVGYSGTPTVSTGNIVFGASQLDLGGTVGKKISDNYDTSDITSCSLTPWLGVVPVNGSNANDAFTLNVTLKFTSLDTGEVFYVYGARVLIPDTLVQWAPNKQYTYVFRITTGVTGNTGTPDPSPAGGTPTTGALNPIVFQDVTIEDLTDVVYGPTDLN